MFLKVGGIVPLEGDFDGQGGETNKWGDRGAKKHKGAKVLND